MSSYRLCFSSEKHVLFPQKATGPNSLPEISKNKATSTLMPTVSR